MVRRCARLVLAVLLIAFVILPVPAPQAQSPAARNPAAETWSSGRAQPAPLVDPRFRGAAATLAQGGGFALAAGERWQALTSALLAELPAVYTGTTRIRQGTLQVTSAPREGGGVRAEVRGRALVYRAAYPATDCLYVSRPSGTEEFLQLRSAAAPCAFTYDLRFGSDIHARLVQGAVQLHQDHGPTIAIAAPSALDADGRSVPTGWRISSVPGGAVLTLQVDAARATYPVLVDPSWMAIYQMQNPLGLSTLNEIPGDAQFGEVAELAIGGFDGTQVTTAVEAFSLDEPGWYPYYNPTTVPHANHSSTALPDGSILIAGGYTDTSGDLTAVVEEFQPESPFQQVGTLVTARTGQVAVPLWTSPTSSPWQVLFIGGQDSSGNALATSEVFTAGDPANVAVAQTTGAMSVPRQDLCAVALNDGSVLAVGGDSGHQGPSSLIYDSCERFDPATQLWSPAAAMRYPRARFALVPIHDDHHFLAIGGQTGSVGAGSDLRACEIYDSSADTWTPTGDLATARDSMSAVQISADQVLVAGGFDGLGNNGGQAIASCELYDFTAGTWSPQPDLPVALGQAPAFLRSDGTVLIAGGTTAQGGQGPPAVTDTSVLITPAGSDQAPVFSPPSLLVSANTTLTATLGGTDADGNALTYHVTSAPQHGSLSVIGAGGVVTYAPDPSYTGSDAFAVRVGDGQLSTSASSVAVTVIPDPVLTIDNQTLLQATIGSGTGVDLATNVGVTDAAIPASIPASQVVVTVTQAPVFGSIQKWNGTSYQTVAQGTSFTMEDLTSHLVQYLPSATYATYDVTTLTVGDGVTYVGPGQTLVIQLSGSRTTSEGSWTASSPMPVTVVPGTPAVISATATGAMQITGYTGAATELTCTIATAPSAGTLLFQGRYQLPQGVSISYQDILNGSLSYQLDLSTDPVPASDSFALSVTDGSTTQSVTVATATVAGPTLVTDGGLSVAGNQAAMITRNLLRSVSPSIATSDIEYYIVAAPTSGTLWSGNNQLGAGDYFAQLDIANGQISYSSNNLQDDSFSFYVEDGMAGDLGGTPAVFSIVAQASPTSVGSGSLVVQRGATTVIPAAVLRVTSPGIPAAQIVYTITTPPNIGGLLLQGATLTQGNQFTQEQVDRGEISYQNDLDGEQDQCELAIAADGVAGSQVSVSFTINHPPTLVHDHAISISPGAAPSVVTSFNLLATDPEQGPGQLIFSVTATPATGTIARAGQALAVGGTFTQADVDAGLVTIADANADSVGLSLSDGAGGVVSGIVLQVQGTAGPSVLTEGNLLVQHGGAITLSAAQLDCGWYSDPPSAMAYTVQTAPRLGEFILTEGTIVTHQATQFTQDDINQGRVSYSQDVGDGSDDGAVLYCADTAAPGRSTGLFSIAITINHPPTLTTQPLLVSSTQLWSTICTGNLDASDPEQGPDDLTFTLVSAPSQGYLFLDGTRLLGTGSTFTQGQIDAGEISYDLAVPNAVADVLSVSVSDGQGGSCGPQSLSITVVSGLALTEDNELWVQTSASTTTMAIITSSQLWAQPGTGQSTVTFSFDNQELQYGYLTAHSFDPGGYSDSSFTLQDLQSGNVGYIATAPGPALEAITMTASDGQNSFPFTFEVQLVAMPSVTCTPLIVPQHVSPIFSPSQITIIDANVPLLAGPTAQQCTVTQLPSQGQLLLDGLPMSVGDTFAVADVAAGSLSYASSLLPVHDDQFSFTYSDGVASVGPQTAHVTLLANPQVTVNTGLQVVAFAPTQLSSTCLDAADPDPAYTSSLRIQVDDPGSATVTDAGTPVLSFPLSDLLAGDIDVSTPMTTALTLEVVDAYGDTSGSFPFSLTATVLPPVVSAPASTGFAAGQTCTFSAALSDAISVADPVGGPGVLSVSTSFGTITLASVAGLDLTGSTSTATLASGSLAAVATALDGLVYAPPSGSWSGSDEITITYTDQWSQLSGSATIAVTVSPGTTNAPPIVTLAQASLQTPGTTPIVFASQDGTAITVSDPDGGTNQEQLTLSAHHGSITLSATPYITCTAGANGTSFVQVEGTLGALNAALAGMTYTAAASFYGSDPLVVTINDLSTISPMDATDSATCSIQVVAIPTDSVPPGVTGTYLVGQTLTCVPGTWSAADGGVISTTCSWVRASDAAGTGSTGVGTGTSYTIAQADAHHYLQAVVTAVNANGGAATVMTGWVLVADSAPINAVLPPITGTNLVGGTLTAGPGFWSDADGDTLSYHYQWMLAAAANGLNPTALGTTSSQAITGAMAHQWLSVTVTADDGHGQSVGASTPWQQIADAAPLLSVAPSTTGAWVVGGQVSVSSGSWSDADGDTISYGYQWMASTSSSGTSPVTIATTPTVAITTVQAHQYLSAVVTASDGWGQSTSTTSAWVQVMDSLPVNSVAPQISGSPVVGATLAATPGTWSDADADALSYTYQWLWSTTASGLSPTPLGTGSTQVLTAAQAHAYVAVAVTANDGYGPVQTAESPFELVANSAPVNTGAPQVTGADVVGGTLAVTSGTWTDADGDNLSYTYQWYASTTSAGLTPVALGTAATQPIAQAQAHQYLSVTVTASDGAAQVPVSTAWVQVLNSAPVAASGSTSTPMNTPVSTTLPGTDVDGDPLTYSVVTQPSHGVVTSSGAVATYTPAAGYVGSDSFTYQISDGFTTSNIATISITITAVGGSGSGGGSSSTGASTGSGATSGGSSSGGGCGLGGGLGLIALACWGARRRRTGAGRTVGAADASTR